MNGTGPGPVDEDDARALLRLILSPRIDDVWQTDRAVARLGFNTILLLLSSAIGQLLLRCWPERMPDRSTAIRYCQVVADTINHDGSGRKVDPDVLVQVMDLYYRPGSAEQVSPVEVVPHMMHLARYMAAELTPTPELLDQVVEATIADCRPYLADPDLLARNPPRRIVVPHQKGGPRG
ncbi:hypothetical protein [Actinocatenispora comari]|uniref:Uncharacterized protein n=1 Tax=Actinocatenispora comari TaxID=2807577 RepID=A0A8J4AJR9_9ACTN|nr:hypothetical protein [Actinocatenispora comari]GIL32044.1 hypothetical protein NUM_72980 [Actinocatenispora comari]